VHGEDRLRIGRHGQGLVCIPSCQLGRAFRPTKVQPVLQAVQGWQELREDCLRKLLISCMISQLYD